MFACIFAQKHPFEDKLTQTYQNPVSVIIALKTYLRLVDCPRIKHINIGKEKHFLLQIIFVFAVNIFLLYQQ